MGPDVATQIMRDSLTVMLEVAGPVLLVALVVGGVVAVLQAATQVHEMTLTFVPKLLAVGGVVWLLGSYMLSKLSTFGEHVFRMVETMGLTP